MTRAEFNPRWRRLIGALVVRMAVIVAVCLLGASPAAAHQSPVGCLGNKLDMALQRDKSQITGGETVRFTVIVSNDPAGACDVTDANVTLTCPAADGTPTGSATACATGASFPAGFSPTTICEVDCVVTVNPGVTSAQARAEFHGTLHDNPLNDLNTADVIRVLSVQVSLCGDGTVNAPGETCDPPGSPAGGNGNTCRNNCTVCGDGVVDVGEQCDDGNGVDTDGCPNCCAFCHECGDGIVDLGEGCDDGNRNNFDGCRNNCTLPFCGDGIIDPGEMCDDGNATGNDGCESDCTRTPSNLICRPPGFWATHSGMEKTSSRNITEAVMDCADGNCASHTQNDYLSICGEKIGSPDGNPADGTTDVDDAASSTEALCVRVQGRQSLELARQLTAAALNCLISGGGADCAGIPLFVTVFGNCNARCADGASTKDELTACVGELNCLNNGGSFLNGLCSSESGGCGGQPLINEPLGLRFEPPGPAGSPNACNAANDSRCTIVDPGHCAVDSLP